MEARHVAMLSDPLKFAYLAPSAGRVPNWRPARDRSGALSACIGHRRSALTAEPPRPARPALWPPGLPTAGRAGVRLAAMLQNTARSRPARSELRSGQCKSAIGPAGA